MAFLSTFLLAFLSTFLLAFCLGFLLAFFPFGIVPFGIILLWIPLGIPFGIPLGFFLALFPLKFRLTFLLAFRLTLVDRHPLTDLRAPRFASSLPASMPRRDARDLAASAAWPDVACYNCHRSQHYLGKHSGQHYLIRCGLAPLPSRPTLPRPTLLRPTLLGPMWPGTIAIGTHQPQPKVHGRTCVCGLACRASQSSVGRSGVGASSVGLSSVGLSIVGLSSAGRDAQHPYRRRGHAPQPCQNFCTDIPILVFYECPCTHLCTNRCAH